MEGGMDRRREEGGTEGGRDGGRDGGMEGGRDGGRDGGREGWRERACINSLLQHTPSQTYSITSR